MGCCISFFPSTELLGIPNETSHLLSNIDESGDPAASFEEPQVIESLEKHKAIVQKAAENLIDISSTRILDRVQTDLEKANKYRNLLRDVDIKFINLVNPLKESNVPKDAVMEQKMIKWIADIDDGIAKM